ncbi:Uncharacterised protein [uncultured archaeon]|nr:Uncharacterised protein [uncultured archaeon]
MNGSTGVSPSPPVTCWVSVHDSDGDPLTVTWATNVSGPWVNVHTNASIPANTTASYQFTSFNDYSTRYYWRVYSDDGISNMSETFCFTTQRINTVIDPITPYTQMSSPCNLSVSSFELVPENVTLYYRWSTDNVSWDGSAWAWHNNTVDTNTSNVDGVSDMGGEINFTQAQGLLPDTNSMCISETTSPPVKDTVDTNTSDVDSSADKGVETSFVNCKEMAPDTDVMTLQESNYGSQDVKASVVQTSDVDSTPDFGSETNFVNCKETAPDGDVMTLQEADRGYSGVSEYQYVNGFTATSSQWQKIGSSPYLNATGDGNSIRCKTDGYDDDWYTVANTTNTGSRFTVTLDVYTSYSYPGELAATDAVNWYIDTNGDNTAEFSGCFDEIPKGTMWLETATITGFDTAAEINAARVWFEYVYYKGYWITIDCALLNIYRAATIDYECDFEFQWTNAPYTQDTKQVCFYVTGSVGESLNVFYRNGAAWSSLGSITGTGWTNLTATGLTGSTYTIRVVDANQNNETTQHSWTIDCLFLHCWNNTRYQIDREYQWTDAPHDDTSEYVCIYVTGHTGSETLNVKYWNGGSWVSLGSITGIGWTNFTATGLTSSTYTIQVIGASETNDASQDTWTVDVILLHTYTTNYRVDHEYQWTTANASETSETLCIYLVSHTGSETLNVKYWNGGSWVSLGGITGTGWKNFTATGLTASTYTIQLVGALETGDTSGDTWLVDCMFLRTYNASNGPWGRNWMIWSNASSNPDTTSPWGWMFNYPNSTGYYEFYSKGKKTGYAPEVTPGVADSRCYYQYVPYPVFSNWSPGNGLMNVSVAPVVSITVSNAANHSMMVTWYNKVNGSWIVFGVNTSVSSGETCYQCYTNASVNGDWWSWKVNASDGMNW